MPERNTDGLHDMDSIRVAAIIACVATLATTGYAEQSRRPESLTLANFQFGPHNRWAFSHLREVIPTANIPHDGGRVLELPSSPSARTSLALQFQGEEQSLDDIAVHQYIDGILVLKDGKIVTERYFGHLSAEKPHLMMSVTKSVVGVLAGQLAALDIVDLSKPVSDYVPELAGSGWGPDSLQTLLDMRDGADYTEDYEDMSSTVRLQDCAVGWTDADYCPADGPRGGYAFYPTVGRNPANLGRFVYKSGSTDVIGWVLEAATGRSLAELISTYIWQPMGAEFDANITVDESGFMLGDGGMSSTLRDLARFGLLILNDGEAFDEQVVPSEFIADLHAQTGDPDWPYETSPDDERPYYRSFWWGRGNDGRDIRGLGVHGQYLHIAPAQNIVVAMYSSWPRADGDGSTHGWDQAYALATSVIEHVSD